MTVSVNPRHVARHAPLGGASLAQLFTDARTHNAFLDRPVPEALLREALDLAKMGPTAANQQPLRVLFLRSTAAKERLRDAMAPGNVDKTMAAPVVAIAGHDLEFYEHLPFLTPQRDFRSIFADNAELAARSAAQSGTLQVAYFILALRALGLDAGPMGGFDAAKVEAEFFPEGKIKANVVINIGYGDDSKLFPRNPRLKFEQMATIL
ncbi:MAG TPA: malonic semialdehyde reductase [Roseiarcus sp.]|jgi:3-hydroxypropanoate dehydrogenase